MTTSANSPTLFSEAAELLRMAGIMPVVTVDTVEQGGAVASALAEGGLNTIEITLRSPAALAAISAAKRAVPGMLVGAGTVLTATQAQDAISAGADFLVTPGITTQLAQALARASVPCIPGVATVSEILQLTELGFEAMKLFPAVPLGGIALLKSIAGPLPHLGFCPTGGIDEASAPAFLALPNVLCVGGSWMVPRDWIASGRFDEVTTSAFRARRLVELAEAR